MGLTLAKCPACGSELNLETDKDYFYCPHCGSKVLKHDERILVEHVVRKVDEAKVRRAEVRQAKVEADVEKRRIEAEKMQSIDNLLWPIVAMFSFMFASLAKAPPIVYIAICVVAGIVAYKHYSKDKGHDESNTSSNSDDSK